MAVPPTSTDVLGHHSVRADNPDAPNPSGAGLASAQLSQLLADARAASPTKTELFQKLGSLLSRFQCNALWVITQTESGGWAEPAPLQSQSTAVWECISQKLRFTAQQSLSEKTLKIVDLTEFPGQSLITVPIQVDQAVTDILCAVFPAANKRGASADWVMSLVAREVSLWAVDQRLRSHGVQLKSLSDFVQFGAALNQTTNRLDAGILMVNELKRLTNTAQVSLLLRPPSRSEFRLMAISNVESVDQESETAKVIKSAGLVGAEKDEPVVWSRKLAADDSAAQELGNQILFQKYCTRFECDGCALLPLKSGDTETIGWLIVGLNEKQLESDAFQDYLRKMIVLASGQLDIVLKAQQSILQSFVVKSRRLLAKNAVRVLLAAILLSVALMFVPWTYKIGCDCQLQLVERRFVAAPYTGLLEKTLVENGDVVTQNQVLARMDGRQLRMELNGLAADFQSEKKRRDSALARGDIAESQIARSEMQRLDSEIQLIGDRLNNLEIRSPVNGVIVSGDLDKVEGAPMEMGQNLFEVGPLNRLLVEMRIPEAEIQYVKQGMQVKLELTAFPFEPFRGNIIRIHPRAEVIEDESVFVAEISIDNPSGNLRPGMKGRAKIIGERYPLGWNLFHGAWETFRMWLIW